MEVHHELLRVQCTVDSMHFYRVAINGQTISYYGPTIKTEKGYYCGGNKCLQGNNVMQGISVKPKKCQSINNYYNFSFLDMTSLMIRHFKIYAYIYIYIDIYI